MEGAARAGIALLVVSLAAGTAGPVHAQGDADGPRFVTHTIAAELASGYQPVVVDLNRDGRLDVIALSTRLDELAWYENPGWERHVLTTGLNRAINAAARDLDGDGIPELVVAHEFGTTHGSSLGVLSLLTHQGDPTQPWSIREIDRTPTVHRVRWGDIDGSGRDVLINAPLSGPAAEAPEYRDAVPLYWYRPDDWARRTVPDAGQGVVHGLLVKPWQDPDRDAVLSTSFAGVHLHQYLDGEWIGRTIAAGDPAPWPRSGASEVETGRLGDATFVTTIEPWHGEQVVVYREDGDTWTRQVIDRIGSSPPTSTATAATRSQPATAATPAVSISTRRRIRTAPPGPARSSTTATCRPRPAWPRTSTATTVSTSSASAAGPPTSSGTRTCRRKRYRSWAARTPRPAGDLPAPG